MLSAMVEGLGHNPVTAYLAMMAVRLVELHRVLKPTGSLYLHCDPTAGHYLKVLLDAIFSPSRFRNEIIWQRTSGATIRKCIWRPIKSRMRGISGRKMNQNPWEATSDLFNQVISATTDLDLPYKGHWQTTVILFLVQANERLESVKLLLDADHDESAIILTRSIFELAVNACYISADVQTRLPEYLAHGGTPTGDANQVFANSAPTRTWKRLDQMCKELGPVWVKHYETFYRYASVPSHAGSFTMGQSLLKLIAREAPSEEKKAEVLFTALILHMHLAKLAAQTFPTQIDMSAVQAVNTEYLGLAASLSPKVGG